MASRNAILTEIQMNEKNRKLVNGSDAIRRVPWAYLSAGVNVISAPGPRTSSILNMLDGLPASIDRQAVV